MPDKKTLDYYVSELRRIEKSRQSNSEKEIKKIFKNLLKDLNSFLAEEYANFSNSDGILSVAVLQEKARYAKFLQEVDEHLKSITADESKAIQKTVKDTYKAVYEGMADAVTSSVDNEDLLNRLEGLSVRPEVMNRAVNNPISGLTLPDVLEKHRTEIIYGIKQRINIGLMTGERYDTMAKGVKKVISGDNGTGGSYGKAMNIVRTETHRVQESGFYDCAKEIAKCLEGSELIYAATWHNMGDQRVRPNVRRHTSKGWKTYKAHTTANHEKLEGLTIKVGDKFEIEPGVFAECPGSSGTARNDCNCRCFLEYSLMNVEEFAKATGKSDEEVKKEIGFTEGADTGSNMAYDSSVNWAETVPHTYTKEEKESLTEYAKEKGINVYNISAFDGDADILKEQIDVLSDKVKKYNLENKITISFSGKMPDDDFAETVNNTITFNTKVLRDREVTNKILNADNYLASTDIKGIAIHETGHLISKKYGNKGVEIAQKAYYNIYKEEINDVDILKFLYSNVSPYSVKNNKENRNKKIDFKAYKEAMPEILAKNETNPDEFTKEYVRLLVNVFGIGEI